MQLRQEVLTERGLTVSPSAPNLLKPQLYRDALQKLGAPAAAKRRTAALVIPDYAVRMAILDFEEFPTGEPERAALLRFRLRKSVPFHIEEAQLSYSIQTQEAGRVEILVVTIARPILQEYENVFVEDGYRVGLVIPSSLAAVPLCNRGEKGLTLLAKAAGANLSVVLLDESRIRLVRSLDLTGTDQDEDRPDADSMIPLLQQTLAYAEDEFGKPVSRFLLCGFGPETDLLGDSAQREFGVPYAPLRSRFGSASQQNAGLLGLLERYAA